MKVTELARPANDRREALQDVFAHKGAKAQPHLLRREVRYLKTEWLGTLLATALVVGGYLGGGSYVRNQKIMLSEEAFSAVLDHLALDQKLNSVLKRMRAGYVEGAADSLDILLCRDIVNVNAQLASASDRGHSAVQTIFSRMAQLQPKASRETAGTSVRERCSEEVQAQKILALAVADDQGPSTPVPHLRSNAK